MGSLFKEYEENPKKNMDSVVSYEFKIAPRELENYSNSEIFEMYLIAQHNKSENLKKLSELISKIVGG